MKPGSLKLRLLAAASLSILAALLLIGALLLWVFERHVRERMVADLGHQLDQLAALAGPGTDGSLAVDGEMTDPRFDQPLGGLYWQIDHQGKPVARSRSLWDSTLDLRTGSAGSGSMRVREIPGPGGAPLMVATRDVSLRAPRENEPRLAYRLAVAESLTELEAGREGLLKTLGAGLTIAFLGLVLAAWAQVGFGLKPLEAIRTELTRVRIGSSTRLDTSDFPAEVLPLAEEINRSLAQQEDSIERARRRAGDLAHGLKTPLAAIAGLADELQRQGHEKQAATLGSSIEMMQRHIERQLALARSQGGQRRPATTIHRIGDPIAAAIDVLRKLPAERRLDWSVTGDVETGLHMDREDFDEVIGNLLDNARKWARTRIDVHVRILSETIRISVCDDGPGIVESGLVTAVQRGTRLDERVHGSGLGLSIVQAILESYGSALELSRADIGGLEARFQVGAEER